MLKNIIPSNDVHSTNKNVRRQDKTKTKQNSENKFYNYYRLKI